MSASDTAGGLFICAEPVGWPRLRAEFDRYGPVWRSPSGCIMVTGYQKALELLKTPQLTSSPFLQAGGRIVEDARMNALLVDSFALKDGIDHRRLRQVVSAMFAPPVIRRLADRVDRIAEDLLRGVTPHSGRIDMVETLGRRLPILVNCTMLGLSVVKEKKVRNWTDAIIAMMRREQFSGSDVEGLLDFLASLRAGSDGPWLSPLIDSLRRGAISDVEFDASVLLLMVSGYSTATSAIGSTLARYLSDPRARDLLDSGRCTAESFAYEAVRLATSVLTLARRVKKEFESDGFLFRVGDTVLIQIAAACRDPSVFVNPHDFDPHRPMQAQLVFGGGAHLCLGRVLGIVEIEASLKAARLWLTQNPATLEEPVTFLQDMNFYGPQALVFHARQTSAPDQQYREDVAHG